MWQQTTKDDPEWTMLQYGEGAVFTFRRESLVIEDDAAIERRIARGRRQRPEAQELKALLDKWRANGSKELAYRLENEIDDGYGIWPWFEEDSGENQVKETRYAFSDPLVRLMKWVDDPVLTPGVQSGGGTILWNPSVGEQVKDWLL